MKKLLPVALWLFVAFSSLFVSCNENDNDEDLNKSTMSYITIEQGVDSVYNICKSDTLVIKPVIIQTNSEKPLSYTWEVDFQPYSHDAFFELAVDEIGCFNCCLTVENEDDKVSFPFVINVVPDYRYGLTVLSCDGDGNSMISFMPEPVIAGDATQFTDYDCFARSNSNVDFAAGIVDVSQSNGNYIIACQGGGDRNDAPAIYCLNERTMAMEGMLSVTEYADFKPTALAVPSIAAHYYGVYYILCENGKVYDCNIYNVNEGVVLESTKLKYTYAQKCLVNVSGNSNFEILLFDTQNRGLSLIYSGYGPYYCGESYNLSVDDSQFESANYFANRELITMVNIRMTQNQKNLVGHQEFLAMSKLAGTPGVATRSEVLYTDFWGFDYVNQASLFYVANQQFATIKNNPITISTPCIANKTYYTLLFADGNKVRRWNYTTGLNNLPDAPTLLTVGGSTAQITGFEMSEDHTRTYVAFYDPGQEDKNGSVWVFNTDTGEILERYDNICYRPVKMLLKSR